MSANVELWSNLRDQARMNIHGVLVWDIVDAAALTYKARWRPGGEARWRELKELLDRLAKEHQIGDRTGLENAVDAAMLIYSDRHGALPKDDAKQLAKYGPKVTKALFRDENDIRIANILTDRDRRSLGESEPWSYEKTLTTIKRIWQMRADLSQLVETLERLPRSRKADVNFHRMVQSLERFWESLGKKLTRTFTPKDQKTKRQLAASDAMKFIESIVEFIDPDAVKKLQSATRHRLRGIAKIKT
jgi:hypothetical protein